MVEEAATRVLVVDNDAALGDSIRDILAVSDVKITSTARAAQALEWLMRSPFGLVIVDLELDRMNGRELLEALRADGVHTPALILSGPGAVPDMPVFTKLGVVGFLQKPMNPEAVKREVFQAIRPSLAPSPPSPVPLSPEAPEAPPSPPPLPPARSSSASIPDGTPAAGVATIPARAPSRPLLTPMASPSPFVSRAPTAAGSAPKPFVSKSPTASAPLIPQIPPLPPSSTSMGMDRSAMAPPSPSPHASQLQSIQQALQAAAPAPPPQTLLAPGASIEPAARETAVTRPAPPKPPPSGPDFFLPSSAPADPLLSEARISAPPASTGSSLLEYQIGSSHASHSSSPAHAQISSRPVMASVISGSSGAPSKATTGSNAAQMTLGRYVVESVIASGGMGKVYRAIDPDLERAVAVKVLRPPQAQEQQTKFIKRFRREAVALAKLRHPNIVGVYDYGLDAQTATPYVVMELVEGESLGAILERDKRLPNARALSLAVQMAEALAFAHNLGIVHRDVKPDNVIIERGDVVRLIDFGMARLAESTGKSAEELLGSPNYLSPELAEAKSIDWRSDQFALATVILEMLSGRQVFKGERILQTVNNVTNRPTPAFRDLGIKGTPPELENLIMRMHAKFPSRRVQDERELVLGLRACATKVN